MRASRFSLELTTDRPGLFRSECSERAGAWWTSPRARAVPEAAEPQQGGGW